MTENKFKNPKGQVVIVLLMITLIALSLGFAISQRSLGDITTSTLNDQSSRAFSAAEAAIEYFIANPPSSSGPQAEIPFDNGSRAEVNAQTALPMAGQALEYPKIGKETIAQFWFSDPNTGNQFYNSNSFYLYFGNDNFSDPDFDTNQPAVEVNVIYNRSGSYGSYKKYYDSKSVRISDNGMEAAACSAGSVSGTGGYPIDTSMKKGSIFYCRQQITIDPAICSTGCFPVLARVRLFYTQSTQKVAVGGVSPGNNLPPQAQVFFAKGSSGQSQKSLVLFRELYFAPPWFDFAIFSAGEIRK